ncbi:hypothetical protein [Francisella sp. 19X1-34]|uniref:hypothetical protein n=1 Tax=Francisella sp. 19X1-34 TaxID=3087177 RepID=UPI002E34D034|nr:hypothetical protein [Francisella sp. 19X1-34]MED7787661.1 hypothetical protein [Francisella sp. 19X1-34]
MIGERFSSIKRLRGSSLVSVMIFGFVILVTVSSLTYIFRYNLLSVKSLILQDTVTTVEQQYMQQTVEKGSIKIGKKTLGNYNFENSLESSQPIYSNKDIDASLYHATPSAITSNILHKLTYKNNLDITKDIIYKSLPKHSMINYHSSIIPINVPYVDINRMSNSEKFYRLDKNFQIKDSQVGFTGFIKKESHWLLISVNNQAQVISLKNLDLSRNYKINIGWNLKKGHWQMMMAIYDKDHLYIFRTKLGDLVNNLDKAALDLSTPVEVLDPPSNIAAISWYFEKDNAEPSLAVLITRRDSDDSLAVIIEDLDYDPLQDIYSVSIKDSINGLGDIDSNNVYVVALDPSYTLAQSPLYIFAGKKMIVYNVSSRYKVKRQVVILSEEVFNQPLVVKKDAYDYYILTYNDDRYFQYKYTKNTDVIHVTKPVIYPDEKIQNIVVKYGLKFIVTKNHLYINDFQNRKLNKLSI